MSRRVCVRARATAETRLPLHRDFRYDKLSARKTASIITSPCGCSFISARPCIVTSHYRSDQVQYYLRYFILCCWPVEKYLRIVAVAFISIYGDDYTRRYNVGNNRLVCIPVLRASLGKNFTLTLTSTDTLIFLSRSHRSNFFTYFLDSKKFVSPLCRRSLRSFHLFHVSFSFEVNHYVTTVLLRITFRNHYIDMAMGILCDIIDFPIGFLRFHGAIVFTMIVREWSITYVRGGQLSLLSFYCP